MCRPRKNPAFRQRHRCFRRRPHFASHPQRRRHLGWADHHHPKRRHRRCSAKAGRLKAGQRQAAKCPRLHSDRRSHLANRPMRRRTGHPLHQRSRPQIHHRPDCRPRCHRRRTNRHFDRLKSHRTNRPGYRRPVTKMACPLNRRRSRHRQRRAIRHRIGHHSGRRLACCWKNRRRPKSRHWSLKSHRTSRTSRRSAYLRKAWKKMRIADRRSHPSETRKWSSPARNGRQPSAHAGA